VVEIFGRGVETGLFSSLLNVVNDDYRILVWKVVSACICLAGLRKPQKTSGRCSVS